jgi:hypothetical protein
VGGVVCPPICASIVIPLATGTALPVTDLECFPEKVRSTHTASLALEYLALTAMAAVNAKNAMEAGKSRSEAKAENFSSDRGNSSGNPYWTVKTRTSAHVDPCGGTATKY